MILVFFFFTEKDCKDYKYGDDYMGPTSVTTQGKNCSIWNRNYTNAIDEQDIQNCSNCCRYLDKQMDVMCYVNEDYFGKCNISYCGQLNISFHDMCSLTMTLNVHSPALGQENFYQLYHELMID